MERLPVRLLVRRGRHDGASDSGLLHALLDLEELDLLVVRGTERIGFEIKRTTTPTITKSLRSAMATLRLDRAHVVHAGAHTFPLGDGVEAVAAVSLAEALLSR